ncbi:MAG: DEAD/DEAH box helicase family protein [Polyangiaceae bacterium]|nr:DEAD/DEAH box helicase family protein [Polyangiaceae bacterium]
MNAQPREGMMAVIRNRRALITGVQVFDADERGRFHLVEVEYTDGVGAETDQVLWEVEPEPEVLEPAALPRVDATAPMDPRELDAMVRAARWSALTPSLPFSGLDEDRPPLAAPLFGAIHPEAYQLVPVLRALEMPRVALMLADAVGLGKTVQAGMVLRELMLRRRIRRVLVLCPASLRTQWREEMGEKFSLAFDVVDRPHTLRLQRELGLDANPWRVHERIIASYHYLKQPDVLEQFRATAEPGEDGRLKWDLLIVDEAHNLAPSSFGDDSDLAQMLQLISPWFEHRVFLTATPHNGHTRSFSGLLESLDPVRFTRKSELEAQDRTRVGESVIRRLKSEINAAYTSLGEPARFSDRIVDALPVLRFGAQERALSDAFHDFKKALHQATAQASPSERAAAAFALEVLQKRLLSGPWAFGQSWLTLLEGLKARDAALGALGTVAKVRGIVQDDTDDDAERDSRERQASRTSGAWLKNFKNAVERELAQVTSAVQALGLEAIAPGLSEADRRSAVGNAATKVKADARFKALETLIDVKKGERLVIFTEYLATLDYLRARLIARFGDGDWLRVLYGGMNDVERDGVKRAFNDPNSSARVLLATDAAGEGLNLQRACRLLLHWDIPWNPGKMEQRNGRLDRHGQERDVHVFHFDSTDDASMRFLGKVLKKRSQTREDQVVTDELFSQALLKHFEEDEDVHVAEERLEATIKNLKARQKQQDVPDGPSLPGQSDRERLDALRAELDLSPSSLLETLETALAVEAGRPRLREDRDRKGRYRFVPVASGGPVPAAWLDVVDQTIREGGPKGPLAALVFDPEHYVAMRSGRPVFLPEPDSKLLHLGHALYHRVMSVFARYRFPGGPAAATRWTARTSKDVPSGAHALVLLTVEELAVNELREPCHHWVRTLAFPVTNGTLGAVLPRRPAAAWDASDKAADAASAREVWDHIDSDLKKRVTALATERTKDLGARLDSARKLVEKSERARFDQRRKELGKAMADNQLAKLQKEVQEYLERRQLFLFTDLDEDERKKLSNLQAEIELRKKHYDLVLAKLRDEETRTLKLVLPHRYHLRGEARVYPIAVEILLPLNEATGGRA